MKFLTTKLIFLYEFLFSLKENKENCLNFQKQAKAPEETIGELSFFVISHISQ